MTVTCEEWTTSNPTIRHVLIRVDMRPHPYVRSTRSKMYAARPVVKAYMEWRNRVRDTIRAGLTVCPYSEGEWLGVAISAAAKRAAPLNAPRAKNGKVDGRRVSSILSWDADNIIKAILDALNGIMYPDDKQIRFFGPCDAAEEDGDGFAVHLWGGLSCPSWRTSWQIPDWRVS